MSSKQTKRPKRSTERAKPDDLTRPAGKEHPVKGARSHINDVEEMLDSLPPAP